MKKVSTLLFFLFSIHFLTAQITDIHISSRKVFAAVPNSSGQINSNHLDFGLFKKSNDRWGTSAFITYSRVRSKGTNYTFGGASGFDNARNNYDLRTEIVNSWFGVMLGSEFRIFKNNPAWKIGGIGGMKLQATRNVVDFDAQYYPAPGNYQYYGGSRNIYFDIFAVLAAGLEVSYEYRLSPANRFLFKIGFERNFNLKDQLNITNQAGTEFPEQPFFQESTDYFLNEISQTGGVNFWYAGLTFRQFLF